MEESIMSGSDLALWLAGLVAVAALSMKVGIGGGLARLNRRECLATIASYSLLAAVIGYISVGGINLPLMFNLVEIFPAFYAVLAIIMLAAGIYTVKRWQKGDDVSKKSFLALIAPCPLLVIATMAATGFLPGEWELNSILVGLVAGTGVFAIAMATYYCVAKKVASSPAPLMLGNVMIAAGMGLSAVVLILPTYFAIGLDLGGPYSGEAMKMMPVEHVLLVIVFFVTFALVGFIKGRYGRWEA